MTPDERDMAWIVQRGRSRFDATAIYLFGSHARGRSHAASDIDLLVVGPSRDRKSTRLNSSHGYQSRMPSSA